jgi:hypothetical protein
MANIDNVKLDRLSVASLMPVDVVDATVMKG